MNRIAKCLCMVAVIALAFTACKKQGKDTRVLKFNGATEQLVIVDDELGGRMYLDDQLRVQFDEGDTVMMFNCPTNDNPSASCIYTVTNNGATWTGDDSNVGDEGVYYAYYPGQYVTPDLANGNHATFALKPTQIYRQVNGKSAIPLNALYMASKSDGTDIWNAFFDFRNICGILTMNFYSATGKKITSVELEDKSFNIVGDVTLKIDEVDPNEMVSLFERYDMHNPSYVAWLNRYIDRVDYSVDNVSKTLELDCTTNFPEGVELGTNQFEATPFYFVLRPLALRDGCTVTVHFSDGSEKELKTTSNHMIIPNHIRRMAAICVD